MRITSVLCTILALSVALVGIAASTQVSRTATGALQGAVTDPTGAVIPGTNVTVTEESTGKQYQTTTDSGGLYRFPQLPPGEYNVRFEARGFRKETKILIIVASDKVSEVSASLTVGTGGGPEVTREPPTEPASQLKGAIHGRVAHAAGPVPALITGTEQATGKTYATTTDSSGIYELDGLPAGKYDLRFEADDTYDWHFARNVAVTPAGLVEVGAVMRPVREFVEVCSGPPIDFDEPAVYATAPGIQLQLYAERNVVTVGSDLWLTVILTNGTRHSIFIHAGEEPGPKFGYKIYASGPCLYDRELRSGETIVRGGPIGTVAPGESRTDRVALKTGELGRGTFTLEVRRPDTSTEVNCCEEPKNAPLVRSNSIRVTVVASP